MHYIHRPLLSTPEEAQIDTRLLPAHKPPHLQVAQKQTRMMLVVVLKKSVAETLLLLVGYPISVCNKLGSTSFPARFRIKKKQRTTNLERSVSDLAGRAEELEREAADLRKENGWLKEIVMLKGNRFSGVNLTGTLPQRADVDPLHDGKNHSWDRRPSRSKSDPGDSFPDDDEDDDGKNKKGKGKKKEDSGEA